MIEFIKIPEERKAIVIGKDATVKKKIESLTETEITIEDDVKIEGDDPVKMLDAKNIITAMGRGFAPEKAMKLSESDNVMEIINLRGFTPKKRFIQKGRLIGTKGKTRTLIEEFTGCDISVYGDTVSIIGEWESSNVAKLAVEQILEGRSHQSVYKFLEKNRTSDKKNSI